MAAIVATPAGRLVTFRVISPLEDANAARAAADLRRAIASIEGQAIVCTDVTQARTLAPTTADAFVRAMRADNPKIERSAIYLGAQSATFLMQLERMIREAASAARRTFRDPVELQAWLGPLLNEAEQEALREFIAGAA